MNNISNVVMCFLFRRITFISVRLCLTALQQSEGLVAARELQTLFVWLMITNKQVQVKTTVRSVWFIFTLALFLRCIWSWCGAGESEVNACVERKWPLSAQAAMSTLRYSAMTSVIVQVADSVTESSSGKFIMETPQTSGTGPLPAGL